MKRNDRQGLVQFHRSPVLGRSPRALNSLLYLLDGLGWLVRNRARYDVLHCQQMFGAATLGLLAKKLLGKPVLVVVKTMGDIGEVADVRKLPFARLRLRLLQDVDRWVALTHIMKDEICTLGVPPERVAIIPNSAQVPGDAAFEPGVRERYRRALGLEFPQICVFTGRLSQEKGLDVLIRSWQQVHAEHPRAHLLLLGEGGLFRNIEGELRALTAQLGLEGVVHFLGHVPNVTDYLLASDLFVFPTRTEGMSNSLLEAMASGTPIVTTDIPPNRVLIEDGKNGILFAVDDEAELSASVSRVLQDPLAFRRLGVAARQTVEGDYSVASVMNAYIALYRSLVPQPGRDPRPISHPVEVGIPELTSKEGA